MPKQHLNLGLASMKWCNDIELEGEKTLSVSDGVFHIWGDKKCGSLDYTVLR